MFMLVWFEGYVKQVWFAVGVIVWVIVWVGVLVIVLVGVTVLVGV
jgi:hypothetical protein